MAEPKEFISKSRLDALTDGVFAFAMTLLVVKFDLPEDFHPKSPAELISYPPQRSDPARHHRGLDAGQLFGERGVLVDHARRHRMERARSCRRAGDYRRVVPAGASRHQPASGLKQSYRGQAKQAANAIWGSSAAHVRSLQRITNVWFTTAALAEGPLKFRDSQFEPIKWSELAGWTADDHLAAYTAYQTSCQALLKSRRSDGGEGLPRALSNVCRKAAGIRLPPQARSALKATTSHA